MEIKLFAHFSNLNNYYGDHFNVEGNRVTPGACLRATDVHLHCLHVKV